MKRKICSVLLMCTLLLVGCGSDNTEVKEVNETKVENTDNTEAKTEETETVTEEPEEVVEEIKYADDEVVNQFIIDFAETAEYEFTDIEKGNIRTKYYCYANDIYVELLNATENPAETFNISYGFGSLSQEEIYAFFTDCLKTLGATDEEISRTIDDLTVNNEGDYMKENYEVNSSITVTYCPTKELSKGTSIGHIEIASSTYGK